jgi:hypothetical protein
MQEGGQGTEPGAAARADGAGRGADDDDARDGVAGVDGRVEIAWEE